jgi:Trk K+ transport system NAD-binding subunit
MVLLRVDVPASFAGRPVNSLTEPGQSHVVVINRMGNVTMPGAEAMFQEGDIAHVVVKRDAIAELRQRLTQPQEAHH